MAFEYASAGAQGYILKILGQHFGLPLQRVKEELADERSYTAIANFVSGDESVTKLVFFYQSRDQIAEDGEFIEIAGVDCASSRAHRRAAASAAVGTEEARQQARDWWAAYQETDRALFAGASGIDHKVKFSNSKKFRTAKRKISPGIA